MSAGRRGSGKRSGRILVTGAAGFIGSHLCERLLEDGYRVWGLDNFDPFYGPEVKRHNLESATRSGRFRLVEGDVRDEVLLAGLFADVPFDAVVHLAARPGAVPSTADPSTCFDVNVTGSLTLLQAMRSNRIHRLVFASSASVYGTGSGSASTEDDAADRPLSPYAASKRSGELLCHSFSSCWGLKAVCLRFFSVYGPRQRPDLLIHRLFELVSSGAEVQLRGASNSSRDHVHVSDVVEAICRSASRLVNSHQGESAYTVLNVGTGIETTLGEVLGHVERLVGRPARTRRVPSETDELVTTCADLRVMEAVLGFRPAKTLPEGMAEFAAWYKSGKLQSARGSLEASPVPAVRPG
jgi:UDP-glucuronate 4-epimerase